MERKEKERREPPRPAPVSHAGIRYEAILWGKARGLGQNGGYIVAIDEKTGEEAWTTKVYDVHYDEVMEEDKQDVFISGLTIDADKGILHVENERGGQYLVDIVDRSVREAT